VNPADDPDRAESDIGSRRQARAGRSARAHGALFARFDGLRGAAAVPGPTGPAAGRDRAACCARERARHDPARSHSGARLGPDEAF
jgi:hypothetical protein